MTTMVTPFKLSSSSKKRTEIDFKTPKVYYYLVWWFDYKIQRKILFQKSSAKHDQHILQRACKYELYFIQQQNNSKNLI